MKAKILFVTWVVTMMALPAAARAQDNEYQLFEKAKNAFDAGIYEQAAVRFDALIKTGTKNPALLLECHKYIAVSKMFVGDRESAEYHFRELLVLSPEYALDPLIFPIEIVDFFTEIKAKNQKQLDALTLAQAREEAVRAAAEEARRLAEKEALTRNVYLERNVRKNSLGVAMIPFGVGQFQNGDKTKGILFLSAELLLTATAITTYALHESLRSDADDPIESTEQREKKERQELAYRATNHASLVTLATVAVIGIIEALVAYRPEVVTWKALDEKAVPEDLRPGRTRSTRWISPGLGVSKDAVHFQLTTTF